MDVGIEETPPPEMNQSSQNDRDSSNDPEDWLYELLGPPDSVWSANRHSGSDSDSQNEAGSSSGAASGDQSTQSISAFENDHNYSSPSINQTPASPVEDDLIVIDTEDESSPYSMTFWSERGSRSNQSSNPTTPPGPGTDQHTIVVDRIQGSNQTTRRTELRTIAHRLYEVVTSFHSDVTFQSSRPNQPTRRCTPPTQTPAVLSAATRQKLQPKVKQTLAKVGVDDGAARSSRALTPDNCSICLETVLDGSSVSLTYPCMHTYCFPCICKWVETKSTCPNCQATVSKIIHNMRSESDYDVKNVETANRLVNVPPFDGDFFSIFFQLHHPAGSGIPAGRANNARAPTVRAEGGTPIFPINEPYQVATVFRRCFRQIPTSAEQETIFPGPFAVSRVAFRRRVYAENLTGRLDSAVVYNPPTQLERRFVEMHGFWVRLEPWLRREVLAVSLPETMHVDLESLFQVIQEFMHGRTMEAAVFKQSISHFVPNSRQDTLWCQLTLFAQSRYSMGVWDQSMRYFAANGQLILSNWHPTNTTASFRTRRVRAQPEIITLSDSDDDSTGRDRDVEIVDLTTTPPSAREVSPVIERRDFGLFSRATAPIVDREPSPEIPVPSFPLRMVRSSAYLRRTGRPGSDYYAEPTSHRRHTAARERTPVRRHPSSRRHRHTSSRHRTSSEEERVSRTRESDSSQHSRRSSRRSRERTPTPRRFRTPRRQRLLSSDSEEEPVRQRRRGAYSPPRSLSSSRSARPSTRRSRERIPSPERFQTPRRHMLLSSEEEEEPVQPRRRVAYSPPPAPRSLSPSRSARPSRLVLESDSKEEAYDRVQRRPRPRLSSPPPPRRLSPTTASRPPRRMFESDSDSGRNQPERKRRKTGHSSR